MAFQRKSIALTDASGAAVDRSNGVEFTLAAGGGMLVKSMPYGAPLEISFDQSAVRIPLEAGDKFRKPFERFTLYHPPGSSGTLELILFECDEEIETLAPSPAAMGHVDLSVQIPWGGPSGALEAAWFHQGGTVAPGGGKTATSMTQTLGSRTGGGFASRFGRRGTWRMFGAGAASVPPVASATHGAAIIYRDMAPPLWPTSAPSFTEDRDRRFYRMIVRAAFSNLDRLGAQTARCGFGISAQENIAGAILTGNGNGLGFMCHPGGVRLYGRRVIGGAHQLDISCPTPNALEMQKYEIRIEAARSPSQYAIFTALVNDRAFYSANWNNPSGLGLVEYHDATNAPGFKMWAANESQGATDNMHIATWRYIEAAEIY